MADKIWNEDYQAWVPKEEPSSHRSKWACFKCRKSFLKVIEEHEAEVKCNECGGLTVDMGYLFKPPPKRAINKWKVMELLGKYGLTFHRVTNVYMIDRYLTENQSLSLKQLEAKLGEWKEK